MGALERGDLGRAPGHMGTFGRSHLGGGVSSCSSLFSPVPAVALNIQEASDEF